ncbi:MAG: discoidin domain-containing protein, partial [Clostridia bacterium]|nr:discoidin domain-containing protein [Clostridia bacterium]
MKKLVSLMLIIGIITSIIGVIPFVATAQTSPQGEIPFDFPSTYITPRFQASFEGGAAHYVDRTIKESVTGKASPTSEVLENAFDGNTATKYLTHFAGDGSCSVEIKLISPVTVNTYLIVSANDVPERDPAEWTLYGSTNGVSWTAVDTERGVVFNSRFEQKVFSVDTPAAYQYYKFVVTKVNTNNTYLQYAELMLNPVHQSNPIENTLYGSLQGLTDLTTQSANGGSDGAKSLRMVAKHPKNTAASGYALLYKNVNLTINQNTKLSYCIKPELNGEYDSNYPGHYTAVDLVFTDGTRLSQLNITDQNGHRITPYDQGATRSLITQQWNYIQADLSSLAGKTIDQILFGYDRDVNSTNA